MEGIGKQTADRVRCVSIVCYKYTLDDEVTRNEKEKKKKIDVRNTGCFKVRTDTETFEDVFQVNVGRDNELGEAQ